MSGEGSRVTPERYAEFMKLAHEQALKSMSEGGIPIGAALVHLPTGRVLSVGHNQRVQKSSNTLHGETDCLENLGRDDVKYLKECGMWTTLSPCDMCTGACLLYKIPLVVMAENENFVGGEDTLQRKGVEVVNLKDAEITQMMKDWIASPSGQQHWQEDIGFPE